MKTREELQQYGKNLRSRMIRAMGGFPSERCPLNARTVAVRKRDGYTVENVLFESWPGVHVSANLYLPDATRFPPPSWSESVRKALDTPMSICVNGALLSYDWTGLAPSKQGEIK